MYKDILYPVDISEEGSWDDSLSVAIGMAQAFNARLHIVTVISDYGMSLVAQYFPQGSVDKVIEKTNKALHKFVDKYIPKEIKVQHIVGKGSVYECIIKTADEINADLIIMSAHRPGLKDYLLGPNAGKVVRHSARSVLVVREKVKKRKKK
ncbi:MAG: universal stress family protein [Rickettsiaceae bacterium]|jgi:nucleotide-binding universal stress UspA family protein|nr:universal stress family protein [Rickettsiaceae bacterium]